MATKRRASLVDSIPEEYLPCRAIQHAWRYTTVDKIKRGTVLIQGLRCQRCKAQKFQAISATTGRFIGKPKMKYPKNYVVKGVGRRTAEQNGAIRLRALTGVME